MQQNMRAHLPTQVSILHNFLAVELAVEGKSELQHHRGAVSPKGNMAIGSQ